MKRIISIGVIGVMVCVGFLALLPANVSADGTPFEYLSEEWRFSTSIIQCMVVEDLNEDGISEIIVGTGYYDEGYHGFLYVINSSTHDVMWTSNDFEWYIGGVDAGDVDNDGVKEIVVGSNYNIFAYNALTYTQEWSIALNYPIYYCISNYLAVGDVDNDNVIEIVVSCYDSGGDYHRDYCCIYNGETQELESQFQVDGRLDNLILDDVDNDGVTEIIGGYRARIYDGITHSLEWESFVYGIRGVGDTDNDGEKEIITSPYDFSYSCYFQVLNTLTYEMEWQSDTFYATGGIPRATVGDIDGDGNPEIIVGIFETYGSVYHKNFHLRIFDGVTHEQEWQSNIFSLPHDGSESYLINPVCVSDIEKDSQLELVVYSSEWCSVYGNPPPTAYIDTISPNPARVGETVSFDCHGTDDESAVGYNWTSNLDGQLSTSKSFTKSDLSYGTHTIYLKVQDTEGLWSKAVSINLTIGIAPNATIDSINPGVAVIGDTISFSGHGNDSDGSVSAYQWISNIDGLLSNSASFNKADLSIGEHTITFRVKDNDGLWSDNETESLIVTVRPTAYIDSINPNPALLGTTVTFNGHGYDSDGSINAYNWTSNIDGLLSTTQSFNAGSLSIGHHTIYYKVKDNNGIWSNPATMILIVGTKPTATINSITPKPVVEGETISFAGSGSDSDGTVLAYLWSSSINGQISTYSSFSTSNLSAGTHTIYFKVQDDDSFWSDTVTDTIKVLAKPTAYIDYVQPNLSAVGDSVSFCGHGSDTDGNIVDYNWTSSIDGKLSNSSLFSISTLSSGSHTISFRVKDNDGLWSATVTTTIVVSKKPTAYIDTINPNPSKIGETVSFMGHGVDDDGSIIAYHWSSNLSGTISTSNVFSTASLSAGKHLISFKVKDNSGLWSDETTAILEVRQSPVASLTAEPTTVYINELVAFDGSNSYQTGGTITHYFFDYGDGTNSTWITSPTTSHEYSEKGTYYARLKVRDNYGIESSWNSVKITVQETPVLILTAGLTNVGIIKSGGERVVPVYVTCYNMSAKNVHIVVIEDSGFIITMIPAEDDVNVGDMVTFNLKLTAPELASNVTVGEKVIQIKAVSDETESNVETIYIVLEKGAGTGQPGGFIPSFEAGYLLAIIGICAILLKGKKEKGMVR